MATEAQVCANRSNAQKSTGPRTEEGKAAVAQNAVKHGLLARAAVLQGEDWEEYTCFHEEMLEELYPDSMQEEELAERIVDLTWRLRRAGRYQNAVFEALYDKHAAQPAEPGARPDPMASVPSDPVLGRMLLADFSGDRVLERVLLYERRIEGSLYRTRAELRRLRQERREEGQKVRRSEGPALSPSFVPIFSRSSPERQSCETNPIPVEAGEDWGFCISKAENVGRGRPTHEEAPCRVGTNRRRSRANRAKQSQFLKGSGLRGQRPDTRPPALDPCTFVRNKPNSRRCRGEPSPLRDRGYGRFGRKRGPGKQSQFAGIDRSRGARRGRQPSAAEPDSAKQSQFPEGSGFSDPGSAL